VLGVRHSITDDILKKNFENSTGLFVDEARDSLDTATASETTDGWLGNALDVISQNLTVTFGTPFPETFSPFPLPDIIRVLLEDKQQEYSFGLLK